MAGYIPRLLNYTHRVRRTATSLIETNAYHYAKPPTKCSSLRFSVFPVISPFGSVKQTEITAHQFLSVRYTICVLSYYNDLFYAKKTIRFMTTL